MFVKDTKGNWYEVEESLLKDKAVSAEKAREAFIAERAEKRQKVMAFLANTDQEELQILSDHLRSRSTRGWHGTSRAAVASGTAAPDCPPPDCPDCNDCADCPDCPAPCGGPPDCADCYGGDCPEMDVLKDEGGYSSSGYPRLSRTGYRSARWSQRTVPAGWRRRFRY